MKKKTMKILSCSLAMSLLLGVVGCSSFTPEEGGTKEEKIDSSKTQLYVYNFAGGFGTEWLYAVKDRFEELHKEDSYEEGKKGVQIMVNPQKKWIKTIAQSVLDNKEEVYFVEYADYYQLKNDGILGDITEAVTDPLDEFGEDRSIADKMTTEQKNFYGIQDGEEEKYYAVPHYAGYNGIIYNIDLFEECNYYFAKTPVGTSRFINEYNKEKSAGPDGKFGTSDDGLPVTYEDFFALCEQIANDGNTPVTWNGANYADYINIFARALATDYDGLEQTMLNYTLNGNATTLATVDASGKLVMDAAPTAINTQNGYELARQAGKFYALDFVETLLTTDEYHYKQCFNGGYSQLNAQQDFLMSGHDGATKPIAMLIDGSWWEIEAKNVFDTMVRDKGESFDKYTRKFGFMPYPKANQDAVDKAAEADKNYTLFDETASICFMKANIAEEKKPLALDFIKFVNSDESLVEFTQITSTLKALDYTIDEEAKKKLTPYGLSLIEMKEESNVVFPLSDNPVFVNNSTFFESDNLWKSDVKGGRIWVGNTIHEDKVTAEEYFTGMKVYSESNWRSLKH